MKCQLLSIAFASMGTNLQKPTLRAGQSCASRWPAMHKPGGCQHRRDPLGNAAVLLPPALASEAESGHLAAVPALQLPAPCLPGGPLRLRHPWLWQLHLTGPHASHANTDTGPVIQRLASSADQDKHNIMQMYNSWSGAHCWTGSMARGPASEAPACSRSGAAALSNSKAAQKADMSAVRRAGLAKTALTITAAGAACGSTRQT